MAVISGVYLTSNFVADASYVEAKAELDEFKSWIHSSHVFLPRQRWALEGRHVSKAVSKQFVFQRSAMSSGVFVQS